MKFNDVLEKIHISTMSMYPQARFYEAQGILDEADGEIKDTVSKMTIIYWLPGNKTLAIEVSENKESFKIINEPWLEDRFMTPYVPANLEEAIERMKSANYILTSHNVVLRHPLSPHYTRPAYLIGDTKNGGYKVDCYTAEVGVID